MLEGNLWAWDSHALSLMAVGMGFAGLTTAGRVVALDARLISSVGFGWDWMYKRVHRLLNSAVLIPDTVVDSLGGSLFTINSCFLEFEQDAYLGNVEMAENHSGPENRTAQAS